MRSSHSLDRLDVAFDDDRLVADAGLLLTATLAARLAARHIGTLAWRALAAADQAPEPSGGARWPGAWSTVDTMGGHRALRSPRRRSTSTRLGREHRHVVPAAGGVAVLRTRPCRPVIARATTGASSATPSRSDDLRLRMKCTPTKYSPSITVLAPSC